MADFKPLQGQPLGEKGLLRVMGYGHATVRWGAREAKHVEEQNGARWSAMAFWATKRGVKKPAKGRKRGRVSLVIGETRGYVQYKLSSYSVVSKLAPPSGEH